MNVLVFNSAKASVQLFDGMTIIKLINLWRTIRWIHNLAATLDRNLQNYRLLLKHQVE